MKRPKIRGRAALTAFIHRNNTAQAKIDARGHERDIHENGDTTEGFTVLTIEVSGMDITLAFTPAKLRDLRNAIDNALGVAELTKHCVAVHCSECRRGLFHPDYPKTKPVTAPVAVEPAPVHFTTEPTK